MPPACVPSAACTAKKDSHLRQDAVERPRLVAVGGLDRVAVHRIARPDDRAALRASPRASASAGARSTLSAPKRQISVSRPGSFFGLSRSISRSRPSASSDGPHFRPIGFLMPRQILDMGVVGLARAVADPDHVAGGRVPVAGGRIEAGHRLLVAEQQRLVAGVETRSCAAADVFPGRCRRRA